MTNALRMSRWFLVGFAILALPLAAKVRKTLDTLSPEARETATASLTWLDRYWDDRAGFLWDPRMEPDTAAAGSRHLVRETAWYAVGLLLRDQVGDRERAEQALDAILKQQLDEPGQSYNGTFYRCPEEPHPTARGALPFIQYDPNWREFIGTTFALVLEEYSDRLSPELRRRMEVSIQRAVAGELVESRLKPTYTNIALMHGFLWSWAGRRLQRPDWVAAGQKFAAEVYRLFGQNGTFEEFNSPTYYGVDLYALSLWRTYSPTPWFAAAGADMEARLWSDIALFYHAGLKNVCGPYDRSYGMDMRGYASLVGLWLRTVLGADVAPFPRIEGRVEHADDVAYAPVLAVLGTRIPADAMKSFQSFTGPRQVRRVVGTRRVAMAWIGKDFMLGGESTGGTREPGAQFHPATAHWKTPDGGVGWMRLLQGPRLDARVEKETLFVTGIGDFTFRLAASGADADSLQRDAWTMPGTTVHVESDARGMVVTKGEGFVDVTYRGATRIVLRWEGSVL